jgi:KaiC/GvpD/RAD55 family RecA-like ATPase
MNDRANASFSLPLLIGEELDRLITELSPIAHKDVSHVVCRIQNCGSPHTKQRNMKEREKRGSKRIPYISEVVCENFGKSLTARTSDISASGVFIHSKVWYEAGSILTLRFSVGSTEIETAGEVCYSIPHIGMGVRFLELKPESRAAIEKLIEDHQDQGESEDPKLRTRCTIPSGVEPVDKLLGGLERGHLYLTRGDAAGKSLFGVEFLIEGLKRGQHGALITPQRREDTVRRFARFGYDCLKDILSGALVLFTYSHEIVDQIQRGPHLLPLFEELGPLLDESAPERIVFDPVDNLLSGAKHDDVITHANQLEAWVRSFGATVVLVANEENDGVIESLLPSVRDSFRFEVRESFDRVVRFMAFEKSPSIPDQAVRVDPSRGISLLDDQLANKLLREMPAPAEAGDENLTGDPQTLEPATEDRGRSERMQPQLPEAASRGRDTTDKDRAAASDAFFAMLDELHSFATSIDTEAQ